MKRNFRKHLVVCLIVGLLIFTIGSCTVNISGSSAIKISNISGTYTLAQVYITGPGAAWGNDLLAPDVITPGNSRSFEVSPGSYDVRVYDTTNYFPPDALNIRVNSGGTTTLYFNGSTLSL